MSTDAARRHISLHQSARTMRRHATRALAEGRRSSISQVALSALALLVDLGFPEFTRHVKTLDSALATEVLTEYPTAAAFTSARIGELANLRYDGGHAVGRALAKALIDSAKTSVGAHHSEVYQLQVRTLCEDISTLRKRLRCGFRAIPG